MPGAAVVEAEKGVERRALFLGKALARVDGSGAIQGLGEGVGRVEARDVEGKGRAQVADDEEGVARGRRCCVEATGALAVEGVEEDGGGGG